MLLQMGRKTENQTEAYIYSYQRATVKIADLEQATMVEEEKEQREINRDGSALLS